MAKKKKRVKLTDKQRKQIIADYIECGNYAEVGRKYGVTGTYVKKLVTADPDSSKKLIQKKEENTLDMISYMDSRKGMAQSFVDLCFSYLSDPTKLEKAQIQQITTAMGTVIDKFANPMFLAIAAQDRKDDPLSESLKELAEELDDLK